MVNFEIMRETCHSLNFEKNILNSADTIPYSNMMTRLILIINIFLPERLVFMVIRDFHATNSFEIQFHFHRNTCYIAAVHRIPAMQCRDTNAEKNAY